MLNKICLMGRLTKDPDLRYTQTKKPVVSFTIACDRDIGEKATDFIDCTAWNATAEFVQKYFRKGQLVALTGRLQSRKWQDKNGNTRTSWEVVCESVHFAERKAEPEKPTLVEVEDDDGGLPF